MLSWSNRFLIAVAASFSLLVGCGNKGDLYLPTGEPQSTVSDPPYLPETSQPTTSAGTPSDGASVEVIVATDPAAQGVSIDLSTVDETEKKKKPKPE